jgi:type VI secretion system protein ImpC
VALAAPRFLLRLPYGKKTRPAERFVFAEFRDRPDHEKLLWGNSAFLVAWAIGQAFTDRGWRLRLGETWEVERLPTHFIDEDGEPTQLACAETFLTLRAAERMTEAGLIPILSVKGSDKVQIANFHSLAAGGADLEGRWRA